MGQYTDSILQFLQYALKILPELRRQNLNLVSQNTCPAQDRTNTSTAIETGQYAAKQESALLCSGFFTLHPAVERKSTLTFLLSLYNLSNSLDAYRSETGMTGEPEIRRLYGCLSSAVDPSRSTSCAFRTAAKQPAAQTREPSHPPCMSDQCRLQLAVLPSYSITAPKLKKYMQLFVDYHSYASLPEEARMEYLRTWSELYLKRYPDISLMEFCAASDSLLGIVAMYASAADPGLNVHELGLLDDACFPWLCGLESLLRAYAGIRNAENTGRMDFCSPYRNLKECEQRLSFFVTKAEEACSKLKESGFYLSLIRIMLGIHLSDPQANFGMLRLTSRNVLKKGPRQSVLYCSGCKLLRFCRAVY